MGRKRKLVLEWRHNRQKSLKKNKSEEDDTVQKIRLIRKQREQLSKRLETIAETEYTQVQDLRVQISDLDNLIHTLSINPPATTKLIHKTSSATVGQRQTTPNVPQQYNHILKKSVLNNNKGTSYNQRRASLYGQVNTIYDFCRQCKVKKIVSHELATCICPKCGVSMPFASHIFQKYDHTSRQNVSFKNANSTAKTTAHMRQYVNQFSTKFPKVSSDLLRYLYHQYSKIHFLHPVKVTSAQTRQFLKSYHKIKPLPAQIRTSVERLNKMLVCDSIPVFTPAQLKTIHEKRNILISHMKCSSFEQNKSFTSAMFFKQICLSSGFKNARLLHNAKNCSIYASRCRSLRTLFQELENRDAKNYTWKIVPFT